VLRKLDTDAANLSQMLKKSGDMGQQGSLINEGDLVASCTSSGPNDSAVESNWILARVVSHSPLTPNKVVVADVDNNTKKYPLKLKDIVVLPPEDETLLEAKQRLAGVKAKSVMAMYPETTSFYKGEWTSWIRSSIGALVLPLPLRQLVGFHNNLLNGSKWSLIRQQKSLTRACYSRDTDLRVDFASNHIR
jgi:hypothetical protein